MTHPAIEAAEAHVRAGRWAEAIDELVAANRAAPAPDLEVALADLRSRAWLHLTEPEPLPPQEPPGPPLPVGESGLPEVHLDELDASVVRAAIHHHGGLLIRGAVSPPQVEALLADIDASFAEADTPVDERTDPGWHSPLILDDELKAAVGGRAIAGSRKFTRAAGGVLLADSPRAMAHLLDLYTELGLYETVEDYLGDRPVMSALKCTLRRVDVNQIGGWHQDGAFLGQGIRAINLWLTLTPCGVDAPGLDLVPARFDHIVETGSHGSYFDWAVGDGLVDEVAGPNGVLRPQFEAGDLLIFDHLFLHRTAIDDAMTLPRHAIEFWCFAASAYPDSHVPLVW